uniref:Putative conserved secreted protein n=1 Tax=Ixodes scapularis TaxID=6945 RepID=A0A4D5S733_IXOSC
MWKIALSSLFLTFAIALQGCHASKGRQGSPMVCANDSSCSNGQLCVTHYKYLQGQACTEDKFCIDVSTSTCSCLSGYTCRKKNCPSSPFECILAEDQVSRCEGPNSFVCPQNEYCAYRFQDLYCYTCPCYDAYNTTCVKDKCGAGSLAIITSRSYTCDGCASAVSVLTGIREKRTG